MIWVMISWTLAMVAGLWWSRLWVGLFTCLTFGAFISLRGAALSQWLGWVQLVALVITPWLLAAQRARDAETLRELQADEGRKIARLSDAARSLLSIQNAAQETERALSELADLYHVTKETSRCLRVSELFSTLREIAPRMLDTRALRLIDVTENPPKVLRATRSPEGQMVESEAKKPKAIEEEIIKELLASQSSTDGAVRLHTNHGPDKDFVAWAPLLRESKPIGVLAADGLPPGQLKTLSIVANQISLQLSRIHLYQQVESLAVTDALTGLMVRRAFMECAEEELVRSKRHGLSCTLLMVDLDHFKTKNDEYGHLVGDVVLRDVAQNMQRNLREIDLIGRFGGEEFILLLVETDVTQAMPIAERFRQLVEVHPIRAYDELLTQTISIGAAGFPTDGKTLKELIERADKALYVAKRTGRNRLVRWKKASVD